MAYGNKVSQIQMKGNTVYQCIFEINAIIYIGCLENTSSETSNMPSETWFLKKVCQCVIVFVFIMKKYKQVKSF